MKKRRMRAYKVELSNYHTNNLLMFIPSLFVSVSRYSFYLCMNFLCIELVIMLSPDLEKYEKGTSIYITPKVSFALLDEELKEKWDFQFSWLWMGYRKFFGKRETYKESIKHLETSCFRLRKKCKG